MIKIIPCPLAIALHKNYDVPIWIKYVQAERQITYKQNQNVSNLAVAIKFTLTLFDTHFVMKIFSYFFYTYIPEKVSAYHTVSAFIQHCCVCRVLFVLNPFLFTKEGRLVNFLDFVAMFR